MDSSSSKTAKTARDAQVGHPVLRLVMSFLQKVPLDLRLRKKHYCGRNELLSRAGNETHTWLFRVYRRLY